MSGHILRRYGIDPHPKPHVLDLQHSRSKEPKRGLQVIMNSIDIASDLGIDYDQFLKGFLAP